MNIELKKRIFTSLVLISLLTAMFVYSYVMVITLFTIAIIVWVEFYALISKIFKKNSIKDKVFRFLYKSISLIYLLLLVYLILSIESHYKDLKIFLLYAVLVAILSDIGGLVVGKIFKGKKLTIISPKKTISGFVILLVNKFLSMFFSFIIIFFLLINLIALISSLFEP